MPDELLTKLRQNVQGLRTQALTDWAEQTEYLVDLYYGGACARDVVKKHIIELYKRQEMKDAISLHITYINVIKRIVDELSRVYETRPKRVLYRNDNELPADSPEYSVYNDLLESIGHEQAMVNAEKYSVLLNSAIIHMSPDFDEKTFKLELVESPTVSVVQGDYQDEMQRCEAVAIPAADNTDTVYKVNEIIHWVYTRNDAGNVELVRVNSAFDPIDTPDDASRYNTMTYYPVWLVQPDMARRGDLFNDIPYDLRDVSLWYNWRKAARSYVTSVKETEPNIFDGSYQTLVDANAADIAGTPASVICTDDHQLTQHEWNPKVSDYQEQERQMLQSFAQSRSLPKSFATAVVAESGVSKWWDELPARKYRESRLGYFKRLEESLFEVEMQMAEVVDFEGWQKLRGLEMRCEFPQQRSEMSPMERIQYYQTRVIAGLMGPIEAIAEERGIGMAEAEEIYDKQIRANQSLFAETEADTESIFNTELEEENAG